MIESSIYLHDYLKFFFRGWLLTVGRRIGAASCGALLLLLLAPPRSINLIITIALIIIIVSFALL